jgi:hypothetical protein
MSDQIQDVFDCTVVSEMAAGSTTLVPLSEDQVNEITQGDDDPLFATFVIESGWSKSRRYWSPEVLDKIREQINGASEPVVGYMGHIKPEDEGFSFPDIQLHWVKAGLQTSSDKTKLLVKSYVLPGTKARDYLKRKLVRTISVSGDALLERIQGGVSVKDFDLESIDLSRPGKAGMKTSLVGLTSEMESGEVKPEEIAALQENELRAHNPALVKTIEEAVKAPLETQVSEMSATVDELKPSGDMLTEIRKSLKLDEDGDVLTAISEIMDKARKAAKDAKDRVLTEVLEKKFKNENARVLVKRLMVSEMETFDVEDEGETRTKIEEMVNSKINDDEELKKVIDGTEIGGGRSPAPKGGDRSGHDELTPGTENENISVTTVGQGRR